MLHHWVGKTKSKSLCSPLCKGGLGGICLLLLIFGIACGAAATATPAPPAVKAPAAPEAAKAPAAPQVVPTPTRAPVAAPKPTPVPVVVKPSGTLNVGQKELGPFNAHPKFSVNPELYVLSTVPISEELFAVNSQLKAVPLLAESWSVSQDFLTWTFRLRKGVQFHKGYGEMTAEDVAWSHQQWALNDKHARSSLIKSFWTNPKGSVETPDRYTVVVNTGKIMGDDIFFDFTRVPSGVANWVVSKKQTEEVGAEAADRNIAGTGPWEIVEHRTGELWRMKAVEKHWRKTPHFAELVFWEIPEESARIAGFQTGNLDSFTMAFDSIPLVEKVKGARVMRVREQAAGEMLMHFHGQMYTGIGTPKQAAAYDPKLPWVSANPDLNSPEWERARKVRLALITAIDVDTIIKTLLRGFARPAEAGVGGYAFYPQRFPEVGKYEFNLDRAKKLLAEAGYPRGGFSITLTPAVRGAPSEVEVGEVIATMWRDIGIDVKFQKIPYDTLRPQVVGRKYNQASNHGTSPSLTPARLFLALLDKGTFVRTTHPWLEEIAPKAQETPDPVERQRLEAEVGKFLYDNVIYTALYLWDAVWPVGPRIEEWGGNIFYGISGTSTVLNISGPANSSQRRVPRQYLQIDGGSRAIVSTGSLAPRPEPVCPACTELGRSEHRRRVEGLRSNWDQQLLGSLSKDGRRDF